ncbi:MAG: glucoamylase [Archangium gephyra]|uniref:Glucoamylase n=1 Tax=Archangium gephyra TaxID=48 RepID=A0A2W5T8N1_9BACT|nr:MAG: glucoamylase [Archangium gephyra]
MMHPHLDYGAIGNGRVLALVGPDSGIDWLCLPRFDSASVFARILDTEKGGTFLIRPESGIVRGDWKYVRNTNVLRGVFESGDASWEIIDFAPRMVKGHGYDAPVELVRIVRPLKGAPRIVVEFDPRPDYARVTPRLLEVGDSIMVEGSHVPLRLMTDAPIPFITQRMPLTLTQPYVFVLSTNPSREQVRASEANFMLEETIAGWRQYARTLALPGFADEHVIRSALCLALHANVDTGGIIAAATTSIPEALNTPRTWDYRYCWLRDAAFVVEALRRVSKTEIGEHFVKFLRHVAEAGPLQPLYGVAGERELPEVTLDHLAGFGGTGPVRVGNAAALQQQNDLNGELLLCLDSMLGDPRVVLDDAESWYPLVQRLVEEAITIAPQPDTGIWEFRSILRHYTFSRAMCWAAMERGAAIARRLGHHEDAARWAAHARREQEVVLSRGYSEKWGCFTQALDGQWADAANLLFPSMGIIDARDSRFQNTLADYEKRLVRGGLMLRYVNEDDFGETTSAFTICSFWWAESLALSGRLDDAIALFNRLLRFSNPLGLYSEDVEPETGQLLGNFPQAYTHVGLIHAAVTIGELLAAREGRVRAWA